MPCLKGPCCKSCSSSAPTSSVVLVAWSMHILIHRTDDIKFPRGWVCWVVLMSGIRGRHDNLIVPWQYIHHLTQRSTRLYCVIHVNTLPYPTSNPYIYIYIYIYIYTHICVCACLCACMRYLCKIHYKMWLNCLTDWYQNRTICK